MPDAFNSIEKDRQDVVKYLNIFNEDFEPANSSAQIGEEPPEMAIEPEAPPPISAADLEAAYARGVQDGQTTALVNVARQSHEMMQALLTEIGTVTDAARKISDANSRLIVQLLLDLLRKFFPRLCADYGPAETTDMVKLVLAGLIDEPEVEIRACSAGIADLQQYLLDNPYDGDSKLVLVSLDTIPPGDATMRWKDGRADRNADVLWAEILSVLRLDDIIDPAPTPPKTRTLIGHAHG